MVAYEGNDSHELSYQDVLAVLPAYAQGQLGAKQRAAVDAYLNRHVDLFQRLDVVETAQHATIPPAKALHRKHARANFREFESTVAFAQVMEGHASTQALPDNPLLMRKAPQRITDQRTGQRFIVPRRAREQGGSYPQSARPTKWSNGLVWGTLALAAVVAMILIGLHQVRLQQQLATAEQQLAAYQQAAVSPTLAPSTSALTAATTVWLTTAGPSASPLGAFFITKTQATLVIQNLPSLPQEQRYQLWLFDERATAYPAARFTVDTPEQPQWVTFRLPLSADRLTQMGITVAGASQTPSPSGPFLLAAVRR